MIIINNGKRQQRYPYMYRRCQSHFAHCDCALFMAVHLEEKVSLQCIIMIMSRRVEIELISDIDTACGDIVIAYKKRHA